MAAPRLDDPLTAEQLRSVLDYDPTTGLFRWREGINHWRAGLPAGTLSTPKWRGPHIVIGLGTTSEKRYQWIGIKKKVYFAHRLAWLWVNGEWPSGPIDHINCDGTDNRITNLRVATDAQNSCNRKRRSDNTSGFKGVSRNKRDRNWTAHITHDKITYNLGYFDTPEAAHAAYCEAARRLHGEFARTA